MRINHSFIYILKLQCYDLYLKYTNSISTKRTNKVTQKCSLFDYALVHLKLLVNELTIKVYFYLFYLALFLISFIPKKLTLTKAKAHLLIEVKRIFNLKSYFKINSKT